jgi:hypothetical protein
MGMSTIIFGKSEVKQASKEEGNLYGQAVFGDKFLHAYFGQQRRVEWLGRAPAMLLEGNHCWVVLC